MLSMTGFGGAEAKLPGGRVVVEIKSVNHRYLDVSVKGPREYAALEARMVDAVRGRLRRGKVDCFVTRLVEELPEGGVRVNEGLARGLRAAFERLRSELSLPGEVTLEMIAAFRDVVAVDAGAADTERDWPALERATASALDRLVAMRREEGLRLAASLRELAAAMRALWGRASARAPAVVEESAARLKDRLARLLGAAAGTAPAAGVKPAAAAATVEESALDPGRLALEVAILAERSDVHEELVRLESHLGQLESAIDAGGEIGRKLDFLLQEIGREVNTLGSKANDAELSRTVIEMKSVAERIREQIQNLE